jgi:hypothetical protein
MGEAAAEEANQQILKDSCPSALRRHDRSVLIPCTYASPTI